MRITSSVNGYVSVNSTDDYHENELHMPISVKPFVSQEYDILYAPIDAKNTVYKHMRHY